MVESTSVNLNPGLWESQSDRRRISIKLAPYIFHVGR
jgi:hypothetical protein